MMHSQQQQHPSIASTASGASTPFYSSASVSNTSPSESHSPSPSPDPLTSRSHDPTRIQALIQVVQQLGDSGVQHKYLSQLGIVFKQLHPTLFVKGILKELVDHAAHCGLVVLSGPAGQQQVELTPQGQSIAKQWRQNHETQNQQQLASLKMTLEQYAQNSLNSTGGSTSSRSSDVTGYSAKSSGTVPGFSFLDEPDKETHFVRGNASSGINNTSESTSTDSLNNTGASEFGSSLTASSTHPHLDPSVEREINTTSGNRATHPRDSERIDLNNIFGPTSSTIFGVTDAEDSEFLSQYHDQEMSLDRFRSKSPTRGVDTHHGDRSHHDRDVYGGSQSALGNHPSSQAANAFSNHNSPYSSQGVSLSAYNHHQRSRSMTGQNNFNLHGGGNNNGATNNSHQNTFNSVQGNSDARQHHASLLQTPHPAQNHINGSNIHAFLSSTNGQQTSYGQQQQQQQQSQQQSQQNQSLAGHDPTLPGDPSALQLLPPLPIGLEEKSFRGELLKHLKYIFHFRVHPCLNFLQKGSCPFDNKNECFDFHSLVSRRRIPRIYNFSNGVFWSYNACRCQAIEKDMRCEKGEGCRYAHNKEEIAYHPSRYKSQRCSYPLRADGSCSRFGLHCAFR